MSRYDLIIFDCDGVLVDSEVITNRVFCDMLNHLGVSVTLDDMFNQFVGNSMEHCMSLVGKLLGNKPPEAFVPEFRRRADEALAAEIVSVEGIETALDQIKTLTCVASNGEREKMHLTLGKTGLMSRFTDRIFCVSDVKNPKPAPDLFLHAAQTLGVNPNRCAVVEDTPTGVSAAIAAGMDVYGFTARMPAHRLEAVGAQNVFSTMSQLPTLLSGN